jgi:hypothetical protein
MIVRFSGVSQKRPPRGFCEASLNKPAAPTGHVYQRGAAGLTCSNGTLRIGYLRQSL